MRFYCLRSQLLDELLLVWFERDQGEWRMVIRPTQVALQRGRDFVPFAVPPLGITGNGADYSNDCQVSEVLQLLCM